MKFLFVLAIIQASCFAEHSIYYNYNLYPGYESYYETPRSSSNGSVLLHVPSHPLPDRNDEYYDYQDLVPLETFDVSKAVRKGCQVNVGAFNQLNSEFDEVSSFMHIFQWMRPECEGIVRAVSFFNHAPGEYKHFYFAIFEPIVDLGNRRKKDNFRVVNFEKVEFNSSVIGWQTVQFSPDAGQLSKP